MRTIVFQKLRITNFKGIKDLEVYFSKETTIRGENGTGKSTIFDALVWCLFGKNSQNDQKFSIKNTVDTLLNRQDHIVELSLVLNGSELNTTKRVYKEIWTKRRGSEETEFAGHETLYFWNNVPCTQKEYQTKVSEVCEEKLFKLLTNPLFFNATLSETERRDTLTQMAGEIPNERVINGTPMYLELFAKIQNQKSLEEFAKEVSFERLKLKKLVSEIPARIDELLRSTPKEESWKEIEDEIEQKQKSIKTIDDEIQGLTSGITEQNQKRQKVQGQIIDAEMEMIRIANRLKGEAEVEANKDNAFIKQAQFDLTDVRNNILSLKKRYAQLTDELTHKNVRIEQLRRQWREKNAEEFFFDESKCICYACNRPLEVSDIEKLKQNQLSSFNQSRQSELDRINNEGKSINVSEYDSLLKDLNKPISELSARENELLEISSRPLAQPKPIDLNNPEYLERKKISEQPIPELKSVDVSDQNKMKQTLQEGISSLRTILSSREVIARNTVRIEELKAEEKDYSRQISDLEKSQFAIESFQKERMSLVEKSINDKFRIVRFKLFRSLVNGGEEQCCETMVNGVPFSDLNHAAQLNAGIDISNALSQYYGVSAPIVVDNSEAVTHFLPTDSQLIRLYVTLDKELTIVNE